MGSRPLRADRDISKRRGGAGPTEQPRPRDYKDYKDVYPFERFTERALAQLQRPPVHPDPAQRLRTPFTRAF